MLTNREDELIATLACLIAVDAETEGSRSLAEHDVRFKRIQVSAALGKHGVTASVSTVDYRIRHDLLAFVERIPDRVGNAHAKCAVGTLVDLVRDEGASPFEVLYVIAVFLGGNPAEEDSPST